MIDGAAVDDLIAFLDEKFTPEELVEELGVTNDDIFDKFLDKILEHNWDEYR